MERSDDLKTPRCIVSYAKDLFVARERENGPKGYGCTLIFDKSTDISALKNAALDAATKQWKGDAAPWIRDEVIKSPFLNGDGKQGKQGKDMSGKQRPELAGKTFIRVSSGENFKPKVFNRKGLPVFEVEDCPSGSTVFAVVNAFTWDNRSNGKGVSFGVSLVQVIDKAEGDAVLGGGGGPNPDKWIESIPDDGDAPESTKGGNGAAGLFG